MEPIPNIVELDKLAAAGQLWSMELVYENNKQICRVTYMNKTNEQIMSLRKKIANEGFIISVKDPHGMPVKGSYQVIMPLDIIGVFLHQQSGYFKGC